MILATSFYEIYQQGYMKKKQKNKSKNIFSTIQLNPTLHYALNAYYGLLYIELIVIDNSLCKKLLSFYKKKVSALFL